MDYSIGVDMGAPNGDYTVWVLTGSRSGLIKTWAAQPSWLQIRWAIFKHQLKQLVGK
jgi:hypothetical protein